MKQKGKITAWNDDKGFGFITPIGGGKQVFVHINAFKNRSNRPELNQVVSYEISKDNRGRVCAENASRLMDRQLTKSRNGSDGRSIIIALIFFIFLALSVITTKLPALILVLYLAMSLLTFIVYSFDKSAAQNGGWRTSESKLHFLSLSGGWPGAIIAQQRLRHKSKKQSFRAIFWITVLLNFSAYIWLLTPEGNAVLQSVLVDFA